MNKELLVWKSPPTYGKFSENDRSECISIDRLGEIKFQIRVNPDVIIIIIIIIIINFGNMSIWKPKRDDNGEWRRLHNEELHSLYRSPNIVRVIKSRRLRWAGHVAKMEEGRSAFKILTGKPTR